MGKDRMKYCVICKGPTEHKNYIIIGSEDSLSSDNLAVSRMISPSFIVEGDYKYLEIEKCKNCENLFLYRYKLEGKHYPMDKDSKVVPTWRLNRLDEVSVEKCNHHAPDNIKLLYNEASDVLGRSYRASAALLRLTFEQLAKHLLEEDKNPSLNSLILRIKKDYKTIPHAAISLMHKLRKAGGDGAHMMEKLGVELNQETVVELFRVFNIVVQEMISRGIELDKLEESFSPKVEPNKEDK